MTHSTQSDTLRVGLLGALGRVGSTLVPILSQAPGVELVAALDKDDPLESLVEARAQVVVDFTHPDAALGNTLFSVTRGLHAVVGTSGLTPEHHDEIRAALARQPSVGVAVIPNFALGTVLAVHLAEQAARFFESVEVIEMHHPKKVDAPSGTATHTAQVIARRRAEAGVPPAPDATTHALPGSRGADVDGVPVHSVRMSGYLAHEEILFGNPGETLVIRADCVDRAAYGPGVLAAAKAIPARPGLTLGLAPLLGL
jgi:4-hydroxy-tetrahydrodipicolinate reductase